ncbi:replication endonuclease, partial [Serratia ureilytica]
LWQLDKTDHKWRSQYLGEMPDYLAGYFGRRYEQLFKKGEDGRRRANAFLRTTVGENILPRLQQVTQR